MPLAAACLLLALRRGVSAARAFASKHGYEVDVRQELLRRSAARTCLAALRQRVPGGRRALAVGGEREGGRALAAVAGRRRRRRSPCRCLFLTGLLQNLPKAVLAAIVFVAVMGLIDVRELCASGA